MKGGCVGEAITWALTWTRLSQALARARAVPLAA
jgi:hypothetical protein